MSMKAGEFLIFDRWKVRTNNNEMQKFSFLLDWRIWCLDVNLISYGFELFDFKSKDP
jgi:hypothetical protein